VGIESPVHLLFLAAVALIVLGPKRLPQLARALGQGIREFRQAIGEGVMGEHPAEHPPGEHPPGTQPHQLGAPGLVASQPAPVQEQPPAGAPE
jgi:TatA/E family protein of Tat protein translocase